MFGYAHIWCKAAVRIHLFVKDVCPRGCTCRNVHPVHRRHKDARVLRAVQTGHFESGWSHSECGQKIFSVTPNPKFLNAYALFSQCFAATPKAEPVERGSPFFALRLLHSPPSGGASENNYLVSVSIREYMSNHLVSVSNGLKPQAGGLPVYRAVFSLPDWNEPRLAPALSPSGKAGLPKGPLLGHTRISLANHTFCGTKAPPALPSCGVR